MIALNRLNATLDPVNRRSETLYDAEGQVLQELRGVGSPDAIVYATRTWTPNGQLDWVEDANNNLSDLTYDGFDRLCRLYLPVSALGALAANWGAGGSAANVACNDNARAGEDYEGYGYDANGNRVSLRLRSGESIAYTYDALNREILKDIPGGAATDVHSRYDLGGRRVLARFSPTVTPSADCSANNPGIDYCYDAVGRLSAETSYGRRLTFGYDPASNRTDIIYHTPAGATALTVNYTYDALNRVDQVRENGATSGPGVLADYAYDAQSRRISLARGNGRNTTYAYTNASRLSGLNHGPLDGVNNANWAYTYTPAGQLASRTLISAYEWGVPALTDSYARNGLNQYISVDGTAITYDPRGNLTNDGSRTLTYDLENRLTAVSGAANATLSYDPLGRLRGYTVSGATTEFLYDGDRLVAEYNTSGTLLRRYVHGPGVDEPLVWYEGSALTDRRWLVSDRQGSVIAATDATGSLVGSVYRYGPYGEPDSWSGSRFRYTGQIALPELQLYHYKARAYSPTLGRFLQTDPVGYEDDLNLYAYVQNDPLNLGDSTGRESAGFAVGDYDPLRQTPEESQRFVEQATALGNVVLDLLPVIGDVKGGAEFAAEPSIGGAAGLIVGALPGGDLARGAVREGVEGAAEGAARTLGPGPFARESVPGHPGRPTAPEQRDIDRIGRESGCHTCGTRDPGRESGHFTGDHQPPSALTEPGQPQVFLPHCDTCSRRQAGEVTGEVMRRRRDARREE